MGELELTFWRSAKVREEVVVKFTSAPIGISFDAGRMPIVVKRVNTSGARRLGVRENMVVKAVDGKDLINMYSSKAV